MENNLLSKYLPAFPLLMLLSIQCATTHKAPSQNGWISLFNGKDIKDWTVKIHHHEVGDNYGNTFRVEDGMIKVSYDQYNKFN